MVEMRQSLLAASYLVEVEYNPGVPIESFDFIVVDECHRSIYNQRGPKVFFREMLLQTRPRWVTLTDVDCRQIARLGGASKDVDPGLTKFVTEFCMRELRTRADYAESGPVGFLDDAEPFRRAVS